MIRGLYAITPDCANTALLLAQANAAILGGARALQYRNKSADGDLRFEQASALNALCHAHETLFIVNDDIDLAIRVNANGVHLGAQDATIASARATLGGDKIVGVSCYDDLNRAHDAAAQGANYVVFGSFFASPTKPGAARPSLGALHGHGLPVDRAQDILPRGGGRRCYHTRLYPVLAATRADHSYCALAPWRTIREWGPVIAAKEGNSHDKFKH